MLSKKQKKDTGPLDEALKMNSVYCLVERN